VFGVEVLELRGVFSRDCVSSSRFASNRLHSG
jgi:hypothetical protein